MKSTEHFAAMPFHWRRWTEQEKTSWCETAVKAVGAMTVADLVSNLNDLIGDSAPENIDHTPLHSLAALIITGDEE